MLKLYKYHMDCGRMGSVSGLFVADESKVEDVIGQNVYFGEILGKHSEIHGVLEEADFSVKTTDQDFIEKLVKIIGSNTINGHNPLSYLEDEVFDEDES